MIDQSRLRVLCCGPDWGAAFLVAVFVFVLRRDCKQLSLVRIVIVERLGTHREQILPPRPNQQREVL